jgi:lysyl-tRNA synthetase class 1
MDEYQQQLRAYTDQNSKARLNNPVFHIHGHNVPSSDMVVPFGMLLNLAAVANADEKDQLWGFIKRYAPNTSAQTHPTLDQAVGFAVRYYNDFVKPTKIYRAASELEREALLDLRNQLNSYDSELDAEALQSIVFACGRERFDPLRDWFKAIYEVLLGANQGPRFGGFIALYGVKESVKLIDEALDEKFLSP